MPRLALNPLCSSSMLGACNPLEELGYRPGTPVLTAGLVFIFPSGAKQYCEIGRHGVTLKCLICVTGLGQRFTGQQWRLNTGLSGHETSRRVMEWSLGEGVLCGRRTHNRDFCSLCVWKPFPHLNFCSSAKSREGFPTSKCRQLCKLEEIQTLTTRQLLLNPARVKQTRC